MVNGGKKTSGTSAVAIEGVNFKCSDIQDVGAESAFVAQDANKEGWYVILEDEANGFNYRRSIRLTNFEEARAVAYAACPSRDIIGEFMRLFG